MQNAYTRFRRVLLQSSGKSHLTYFKSYLLFYKTLMLLFPTILCLIKQL